MLTIAEGAVLPSGTYRLGAQRHAKLVRALGGAAPADGSAHPLAAWLIAMGGIGFGIGELFAAAGVPLQDGPMLGACKLELQRPLDVETTYEVSGRIAALQQKTGRKLGRFDVLTLQLDVEDAARCTCSMILPRP
jgi:hypothetical protein